MLVSQESDLGLYRSGPIPIRADRIRPGSILLADSILRRENDPSLVQVFRQESSLAVRMIDYMIFHF